MVKRETFCSGSIRALDATSPGRRPVPALGAARKRQADAERASAGGARIVSTQSASNSSPCPGLAATVAAIRPP